MIDMQGILWQDLTKKRPVTECIQAAAARYQAKFGHRPDTCYVHPDTINGTDEVEGVRVLPDKYRQINEYWVGVTGSIPVDVEPEEEPVEVEEVKPKSTGGVWVCGNCGESWSFNPGWCSECGWDGRKDDKMRLEAV